MKKLDLEQLRTGKSKNIKIGELSQEVIDILNLEMEKAFGQICASYLYLQVHYA